MTNYRTKQRTWIKSTQRTTKGKRKQVRRRAQLIICANRVKENE